jgi:hypothetical protein
MRIGSPGHDHARIGTKLRRLATLQRFLVRQHVRDHFEAAVIGIGIAPVPLVAGGLDRERVLRRRRVLRGEKADRRHGDDHQDEHRQQGPDHFDQRVVAGLRRDRIGAAAEARHHEQQQHQHEGVITVMIGIST